MKTWLVSRHPGTIAWFEQNDIHVNEVIEHLDGQKTQYWRSGVFGILPIHLIADLNTQGVEYVHLALTVPHDLRGQELSPGDMDRCQPRLEVFSVQRLGAFSFS